MIGCALIGGGRLAEGPGTLQKGLHMPALGHSSAPAKNTPKKSVVDGSIVEVLSYCSLAKGCILVSGPIALIGHYGNIYKIRVNNF